MKVPAKNRYGYCPVCGACGVSRQRRINGDDMCINGHTYQSANALTEPMPFNGDIDLLLSRLDGAAKYGLDLSPGDELCRDAAIVIRQLQQTSRPANRPLSELREY